MNWELLWSGTPDLLSVPLQYSTNGTAPAPPLERRLRVTRLFVDTDFFRRPVGSRRQQGAERPRRTAPSAVLVAIGSGCCELFFRRSSAHLIHPLSSIEVW